jgi:large subunit ribosomal protein L23
MAILDRFKKNSPIPSKPSTDKGVVVTEKKPAAKKPAEAPKAEAPKVSSTRNALVTTLLRMPLVSEKAARHADKGTYVFRVPIKAEKISIRKAVESMYGVTVDKVRIITIQGKPVRRGKRISHRQAQKKALVTLKKGQTIALYEGV